MGYTRGEFSPTATSAQSSFVICRIYIRGRDSEAITQDARVSESVFFIFLDNKNKVKLILNITPTDMVHQFQMFLHQSLLCILGSYTITVLVRSRCALWYRSSSQHSHLPATGPQNSREAGRCYATRAVAMHLSNAGCNTWCFELYFSFPSSSELICFTMAFNPICQTYQALFRGEESIVFILFLKTQFQDAYLVT